MSAASPPLHGRATQLSDPALRRSLNDMVRRRVPPGEVDDIVQSTLTEALASSSAPDEPEALRKWIWGIARHKVVDYHRKAKREVAGMLPDVEGPSAPHAAIDLLRWAEGELPEGENHQETLDWLLREGEGEKLEAIASSEKVPAPRVRQRVTRLRKHFRTRWEAQVAALVAVVGVGVVAWLLLRTRQPDPDLIVHESPSAYPSALPPFERAQELRRLALERCRLEAWQGCLEDLDRAAALDPPGDAAPRIAEARRAAAAGLAPAAAASSDGSPQPSSRAKAKAALPFPSRSSQPQQDGSPLGSPLNPPDTKRPQGLDMTKGGSESGTGSAQKSTAKPTGTAYTPGKSKKPGGKVEVR
jgi:DNA-directed RNA polymerase specialized sigma24 family protein